MDANYYRKVGRSRKKANGITLKVFCSLMLADVYFTMKLFKVKLNNLETV